MTELKSGVTVVLGGQWGDEGKGKLVDILVQEADVVARCQVSLAGQLAELTGEGSHVMNSIKLCIYTHPHPLSAH